MIVCELYSLNDVALDTAERFADRLGAHLDVDRAVRLLADPNCVTNEYRRQIRAFEALVTALANEYQRQVRINPFSSRAFLVGWSLLYRRNRANGEQCGRPAQFAAQLGENLGRRTEAKNLGSGNRMCQPSKFNANSFQEKQHHAPDQS
jgi:hypothetical protein